MLIGSLRTHYENKLKALFSSGSFSFFISILGLNASNFLFHIILSRQLGPNNYGLFGSLLGIIGLLSVPLSAIQMATTMSAVNSKNQGHDSLLSILKKVVFASTLASFCLILCHGFISNFFHVTNNFLIILLALWMPVAGAGSVLSGTLIGQYNYRPVAISTFVGGGPVRIIIAVFLVSQGSGVTGAIFATLIAQIFMTSYLVIVLRSQVTRGSKDSNRITINLKSVLISAAATIGLSFFTTIDSFLSRHYMSNYHAGIYSAASVAGHVVYFAPGAISIIIFPKLADNKLDENTIRKSFIFSVVLTAIIAFVCAIGLTTFSKLIIEVLFGKTYMSAQSALWILSIQSMFLGAISLFVLYHIGKKSYYAFVPWIGVLIAIFAIKYNHATINNVAFEMLLISVLVLVMISMPLLRNYDSNDIFHITSKSEKDG